MAKDLQRATPDAWSILCDFDGTVAVDDVIDGLLERYGRPGWQELEQDWREGRIGSRECMQRQVELLDLDRAELDGYLDQMHIDPDFPAFVDRARALGHTVGIVSDGIDYAIRRILQRHHLQDLPIAANRWIATESPRRWRLASPFEAQDCGSGTCKCERISEARNTRDHPVLLIGDGMSDFCAAGSADYVFAKAKLIDHCHAAAIPYRAVAGFQMAIDLLPHLAKFAPATPVRA